MMKKGLILPIIFLLIFCFSCSSTKALKRTDKTVSALPAETIAETDNRTDFSEKIEPDNITGVITSEDNAAKTGALLAEEKRRDEKVVSSVKLPMVVKEQSVKGEKISLNFDNADIYEVINALSDLLNISYIIDPGVKGRVNIHTTGTIEKDQLLSILETVFDMNNIALVKFGDIYKIVPVKEAKSEILDINIGRDLDEMASYDRVKIQIVPLRYVDAAEMAKVLKPFLGKGGDVFEYKKGNYVIIVETTATIKKLLQMVNIIDVDTFESTKIHFFKLKIADVNDVSKELEDIFSYSGIPKTPENGIGIKFLPIERINCVLAVSSIEGIFEKVEHWVSVLDTIDVQAEEKVYIYFVENGKAVEIADVLGSIYGKGSTSTSKTSKSPQTSRQSTSKKTTSKQRRSSTQQTTEAPGLIEGDIKIVTDESTNSIIVLAMPSDYAIILDTIKKLDIIPKQVLIEVLIAEVTLSGDTQFGIEWALKGNSSIGGYNGQDATALDLGLAAATGPGFSYAFDSNRLKAFLRAQASKNKLNILSSPHILAADNKEARIEVGKEVPIVTSEYIPQDVQTNTSTSRSIEYRSTGVILSVTPRINEKGLVSMEITQEVSEAQPVVAGGIQSPEISNRKAETSLVVQHGQTIAIGGLIKEQTSETITGVPFLSSIPLLSYLFSNTTNKKEKTELVILITPHVVNSIDDADITSREFKEKLGQIKKLIKKSSNYWKSYQ